MLVDPVGAYHLRSERMVALRASYTSSGVGRVRVLLASSSLGGPYCGGCHPHVGSLHQGGPYMMPTPISASSRSRGSPDFGQLSSSSLSLRIASSFSGTSGIWARSSSVRQWQKQPHSTPGPKGASGVSQHCGIRGVSTTSPPGSYRGTPPAGVVTPEQYGMGYTRACLCG